MPINQGFADFRLPGTPMQQDLDRIEARKGEEFPQFFPQLWKTPDNVGL
jgi:hypothetical protein